MRQVRGLVVGGEEEHIEGSRRLQVMDLVLVDNLKVFLIASKEVCD